MPVRNATIVLFAGLIVALAGCSSDPGNDAAPAPSPATERQAATGPAIGLDDDVHDAAAQLAAALAAQPDETQARYLHRRPGETLSFFGLQPGMSVVEVFPGGGWYSKILLPYLGENGRLIGVDYPIEIFSLFGFMNVEQLQAKETWVETWTATAQEWRSEGDAQVSAFVIGALPEDMIGTADAVVMIRALHNLARFESEGDFLEQALRDVHAVLRPGGIVGVVQHEARPEMPDDWADGGAGYLKRAFVIERFEAAGFELVAQSDLNANPLDQPSTDEVVWRLPPNLATSRNDAELREQMQAIGESHRMTLKFRKPAE